MVESKLASIIFGIKMRQARTDIGLSLSAFAAACDLSPSYITEIEKGRKHPRADKIMRMAKVLGKEYDELVSIKLDPSLSYLESTISSAALQQFPFSEFGIEGGDLVNLLTREPEKASALLRSILELFRRYDLKGEAFIRGALRSYQEIHENYFPDLEEAALAFASETGRAYGLRAHEPASLESLQAILEKEYGYVIDDSTLAGDDKLSSYRAAYIPGKDPRLLVHGALTPMQRKFLFACELGYRQLQLEERSLTSPPDEIPSFEQLLGDFRAAYFGGALLMPQKPMLADLKTFFARKSWDPSSLLAFLERYAITPEMLLYRMSELIPSFFGMKIHFLRFHRSGQAISLSKQLNMNRHLVPSGIGLQEHFCRRWLSLQLLESAGKGGDPLATPDVGVQVSEFLGSGDRFLTFGFARTLVMDPKTQSSIVVGFQVDEALRETIRWADDAAIPVATVNETCERCSLSRRECPVRAAPPVVLNAERERSARRSALDRLQGHA